MRTLFRCIMVLLVLGAFRPATTLSRDAEGRLTFIRYPISTRPEFVPTGGTLTVDVARSVFDSCTCSFHLFLVVGGQRMEINAVQLPPADDATYRFSATVPQGTTPGLYDLAAHKGANDDVSNRAVAVVNDFPTEYTVLHLTDIHIGQQKNGVENGAPMFTKLIEKANEIKPDFVLVTGDDTNNGTPEQFKTFLGMLDGIHAPTFVVAGNHDFKQKTADAYLGTSRYDFTFGKDFYLGFDTQEEIGFPDPTKQFLWVAGEVQAHAQAPLKVMFSHRFDQTLKKKRLMTPLIMLPNRVTLFLYGHVHVDQTERCGPGVCVATPASVDGFYRVLNVKGHRVGKMRLYSMRSGKK